MAYLIAVYGALIATIALNASPSELYPAQTRPAAQAEPYRSQVSEFEQFVDRNPDEVFVKDLSPKAKSCIKDFRAHKRLPNGLRFGDSVRNYDLRHRSVSEVRRDMDRMGCPLKVDVIREPRNNQPTLYRGKTVPLWIFLCRDGGVVRVKPLGDPTSPLRPWVHGSKALRYPYDSVFDNFSDEVVKIDFRGHAVPKARVELARQDLLMGWVEASHADLQP